MGIRLGKSQLLLILIYVSCQMTYAQDRIQDSTQGFSFEVNYWFNLHHFLWMESFLNVEKDSILIHQRISKGSQKTLDAALRYYKENLVEKDLRSSDV